MMGSWASSDRPYTSDPYSEPTVLQPFTNDAPPAIQSQCSATHKVPPLDETAVAQLAAQGITLRALIPLGAEVFGLDLRTLARDSPIQTTLQTEMAKRGYLVFRSQGVLSGDEQVSASALFGGQRIHSTHGVHPKAPNEHIFRLSNDNKHGILGVGPQWHNDGSFVRAVFSHVGYHIVRVPENGGATEFCHLGAAFASLTEEEQETWSRRVSVNSNGGRLHPLVFEHPISGRKSVWLHLGMTGAVLEMEKGVEQVTDVSQLRLLQEGEMMEMFNRYNELLSHREYSHEFEYSAGDLVIIDNLAIAHRASPNAHATTQAQGLRILHRTTVAGMVDFDPAPQFGLPPTLELHKRSPFGDGVWIGAGIGFRWDDSIRMQN